MSVIIVVLFGAAESKDWMLPKSLGGVESRHEKRSFPMTPSSALPGTGAFAHLFMVLAVSELHRHR
jgi:hypothetical protein